MCVESHLSRVTEIKITMFFRPKTQYGDEYEREWGTSRSVSFTSSLTHDLSPVWAAFLPLFMQPIPFQPSSFGTDGISFRASLDAPPKTSLSGSHMQCAVCCAYTGGRGTLTIPEHSCRKCQENKLLLLLMHTSSQGSNLKGVSLYPQKAGSILFTLKVVYVP